MNPTPLQLLTEMVDNMKFEQQNLIREAQDAKLKAETIEQKRYKIEEIIEKMKKDEARKEEGR